MAHPSAKQNAHWRPRHSRHDVRNTFVLRLISHGSLIVPCHIVPVIERESAMLTQVPRTPWGGVADGCFRSNGFFRIERRDGVF
jgi:hypothetical protein